MRKVKKTLFCSPCRRRPRAGGRTCQQGYPGETGIRKRIIIIESSHLEARDGLGNGDKLARVVGEHLSDLEGSVKICQETFPNVLKLESRIPGMAETGTSRPSSPWRP